MTSPSVTLRNLAEQATSGPWGYYMGALRRDDQSALRLAIFDTWEEKSSSWPVGAEANGTLAALAPALAVWAADAAEALDGVVATYGRELEAAIVPLHGLSVYLSAREADVIGSLLARLGDLVGQEQGT